MFVVPAAADELGDAVVAAAATVDDEPPQLFIVGELLLPDSTGPLLLSADFDPDDDSGDCSSPHPRFVRSLVSALLLLLLWLPLSLDPDGDDDALSLFPPPVLVWLAEAPLVALLPLLPLEDVVPAAVVVVGAAADDNGVEVVEEEEEEDTDARVVVVVVVAVGIAEEAVVVD